MLVLAGLAFSLLTPRRLSSSSPSLDSSLLAHCGVLGVTLRLRVSTRDTDSDLRTGSRDLVCDSGVDWYRFAGGPGGLGCAEEGVRGVGEGFAVTVGAFLTVIVLCLMVGLPVNIMALPWGGVRRSERRLVEGARAGAGQSESASATGGGRKDCREEGSRPVSQYGAVARAVEEVVTALSRRLQAIRRHCTTAQGSPRVRAWRAGAVRPACDVTINLARSSSQKHSSSNTARYFLGPLQALVTSVN